MNDEHADASRLRRATASDIDTIARWHPIASEEVRTWWVDPEAEPWVMISADDELVAYGELWLDPDEDEVELARLIVAPKLRGRGLGRELTELLVARAATTGLTTTMLRTTPDNQVAINCYLSCGFNLLDPEQSAIWNEGQRRDWVWMTLPR
jgi:ribosomal protein S18 acetylase RimI-like enzyme